MDNPKPMTKEELAKMANFPQVHKDAIEKAIWNGVLTDDPGDKEWPDYFRAHEVQCQLGCLISQDDELEDGEYETECIWFSCGWKARETAQQAKLI